MMWLYVVLVVVVLAALPVTWWLKREGDRAWRRRQSKVGQITVRITADAEPFVRAMREAARATERLARQLGRRPMTRRARMWAWVHRVSRGVL